MNFEQPLGPAALRQGSLGLRVASGVVILFAFVALVLIGRIAVYALAFVVAAAALWELSLLTARIRLPAPTWLLVPAGLYITFSGTLLRMVRLDIALAVSLLLGLAFLLMSSPQSNPLARWALALGGGLYVGLPLNYYLLLYVSAPRGLAWVLLAILGVVATDVAALLVGGRLGRHPFFQQVSPHKTLEGAAAGVLAPVLLIGVAGHPLLGIPIPAAPVLGLLVGIAAELGDLVESQMKRSAGMKDSSHLIPGHGGVLDRIDSVLFAGPAVYLCALALHLAG